MMRIFVFNLQFYDGKLYDSAADSSTVRQISEVLMVYEFCDCVEALAFSDITE